MELDELHDSYLAAPQISLSEAASEIRYAEYQMPITAGGIPSDSLFYLQRDLEQSQDHDVDAPGAWDYAGGSNSTRLAVLDTGIWIKRSNHDPNYWLAAHPDMELYGYDYQYHVVLVDSCDVVDNDATPTDVSDNAHGSLMCGIASAMTGNSRGIAGMGYHCCLLPIRISEDGDEGAGTIQERIKKGVIIAVQNGAKVVNIS